MPLAKRDRREPTDDWQQLRLYVATPEQEAYELLRPIVLFGRTPQERARETGIPERTLRRKADRFDAAGMPSLFEATARAAEDRRALPPEIRQAILDLKAEHPPLRVGCDYLVRSDLLALQPYECQDFTSEQALTPYTTRCVSAGQSVLPIPSLIVHANRVSDQTERDGETGRCHGLQRIADEVTARYAPDLPRVPRPIANNA